MPNIQARILLIEANPSQVTSFKQHFETKFYYITVATDATNAHEMLKQALSVTSATSKDDPFFLPDLILINLQLEPAEDGLVICAKLKQYNAEYPRLRSIPILVFTTNDAPQEMIQAFKVGAAYFQVLKPLMEVGSEGVWRGLEERVRQILMRKLRRPELA